MTDYEAKVKKVVDDIIEDIDKDTFLKFHVEIAIKNDLYNDAGLQVIKSLQNIIFHIIGHQEYLTLTDCQCLTFYGDCEHFVILTAKNTFLAYFSDVFEQLAQQAVDLHEGPLPEYFPYDRYPAMIRQHRQLLKALVTQ